MRKTSWLFYLFLAEEHNKGKLDDAGLFEECMLMLQNHNRHITSCVPDCHALGSAYKSENAIGHVEMDSSVDGAEVEKARWAVCNSEAHLHVLRQTQCGGCVQQPQQLDCGNGLHDNLPLGLPPHLQRPCSSLSV